MAKGLNKIYTKLSKDEKKRGVVFSSQLKVSYTQRTCKHDAEIIEVHKNDPDKVLKIQRLKDDTFFKGSPWKFNRIKE